MGAVGTIGSLVEIETLGEGPLVPTLLVAVAVQLYSVLLCRFVKTRGELAPVTTDPALPVLHDAANWVIGELPAAPGVNATVTVLCVDVRSVIVGGEGATVLSGLVAI